MWGVLYSYAPSVKFMIIFEDVYYDFPGKTERGIRAPECVGI